MFPALLASSKHLLLTLLIQLLTDMFPVKVIRILILNDPKKEFPLLSGPGSVGDAGGAEREVPELTGCAIPVWNESGDALPVQGSEVLTIHAAGEAVPFDHEEQVVGLIYLPVLAS
jgi:hypothetical protein